MKWFLLFSWKTGVGEKKFLRNQTITTAEGKRSICKSTVSTGAQLESPVYIYVLFPESPGALRQNVRKVIWGQEGNKQISKNPREQAVKSCSVNLGKRKRHCYLFITSVIYSQCFMLFHIILLSCVPFPSGFFNILNGNTQQMYIRYLEVLVKNGRSVNIWAFWFDVKWSKALIFCIYFYVFFARSASTLLKNVNSLKEDLLQARWAK